MRLLEEGEWEDDSGVHGGEWQHELVKIVAAAVLPKHKQTSFLWSHNRQK